MNHAYHCKFCGKPGILTYDPVPEFQLAIEKWLKIICCNRCGIFYAKKRGVQDKLFANCMIVLQTHRAQPQPKNAEQILAIVRTRISNRCNEFAELVCDYLKIQTVNDAAFPEMLMEKPNMVNIICSQYFAGLRRQYPARLPYAGQELLK